MIKNRFLMMLSYAGVGSLLLVGALYLMLCHQQEPHTLNEQSRKDLPGSFIKLNEGVVRYELKGPDTGKVVVLIHGAGSGFYAWDQNFNWLADRGFRVLRYDLYGRGYSDRPRVQYNLELFRSQLVQLLDTLNLDSKVNLVGVSMGTTIAIDYAKDHKDSVEHLILVDPASLGMGNAPWYVTKPIVSDLLFTFYWRPRAVDKQMKEFYDEKNVKEYRAITEDQMTYKGFKRAIRSTWIHTLGLNMSEDLKSIASTPIKTHLIWGKNDPLIPHQGSAEYLKLIPQSTLSVIDKAGHLSNYERPDSVNAVLFNILK